MNRYPLVRRIDEIDTSHVKPEPWFPGKWKARYNAFLRRENDRLARQLALARIKNHTGRERVH